MRNWTIFIYLAAHNNLDAYARRSIEQVWDLGSTDQIKIVTLIDTPDGAKIYDHKDPKTYFAGKPPDQHFDSGDPKQLIKYATHAFQAYPAEHYGLILWSHGTGWMPHDLRDISPRERKMRSANSTVPALFRSTLETMMSEPTVSKRAICFDDGSQHSIDTVELEKVVTEITTAISTPDNPRKLDLLGMDACLMASIEVAYQLRQQVDYMVASEELVPATSWPYSKIVSDLHARPNISPKELSTLIVTEYSNYHKKFPPKAGDVTKCAIELAGMDALKLVVRDLAKVLIANMPEHRQTLWKAQKITQYKEVNTNAGERRIHKFKYQLWDLRSVAQALTQLTQNEQLKQAAEAVVKSFDNNPSLAVLKNIHHGIWFDEIGGLSVYLPPPNISRISRYYGRVAFANDALWDKMISRYQTL